MNIAFTDLHDNDLSRKSHIFDKLIDVVLVEINAFPKKVMPRLNTNVHKTKKFKS